jgi:fumarate hydratase class II
VNFAIGGPEEAMPIEIPHAYGVLKSAAATVNARQGHLSDSMAEVIRTACNEVASGRFDDEFPLKVWQTGSGTQTNMNVNEVVANRSNELLGQPLGTKSPVHPNDHVNASQSSNDTFPTAMHIAADAMLRERLVPSVTALAAVFDNRAGRWANIVKVGRTHLQEATPITLGQVMSGYSAMLADALDSLERESAGLLELALGGTAVGTGVNTTEGFAKEVAREIAAATGRPFVSAPNKFAAQGSLDASLRCSSGLRNLAVSLSKVANDIRWLGSTAIGELRLPANEPGSSIMPGKVNPTQAEAMLMVCAQVIGNDSTISIACKDGNFELNVGRPVVAANLLRSMRILADACNTFRVHMVEGMEPDHDRISLRLEHSTMLVTALAPEIGYDAAAEIAHLANAEGIDLRTAALRLGVDADLYDRVVVPIDMTRPSPAPDD